MANNHEQFLDFHTVISITINKISTLKRNRKALRDRIRKYYKDNYPATVVTKTKATTTSVLRHTSYPLSKSK